MAEEDPNWAISAGEGVKCPECAGVVTGVNWLDDGTLTTGMALVPCGHQLSIPPWQLGETGQHGALEFKQVGT